METGFYDIVKRTKGEFYVGVVGSVRSGKSTFIKRFMEKKILPFVQDEFLKNKIIDELPQSAAGKTIMTVEPKFIPTSAVTIEIDSEVTLNVRLVDSVGYIIPNAQGYYTDDGPRLVKTPWFEEAIPFKDAAELGTRKVIENHSNLGIVMTSDGTINDFARDDFQTIEEEVINEMLRLDKPFVVILNSISPNALETQKIKQQLEKKYEITVLAINVLEMTDSDIDRILKSALSEFKISELNIKVPSWFTALEQANEYKAYLQDAIQNATEEFKRFKHVDRIKEKLRSYDLFKTVEIKDLDPSTGEATIEIACNDELYYQVIDELLDGRVKKREEFIAMLQEYRKIKLEYDGVKGALEMVKKTGYGISIPVRDEMRLDKPSVIKQGGRYGVKLKAVAPSIHMIRVDVESTFEPIIGTEEQSRSLVDSLNNDENAIWDSVIFGRSLSDVVSDGIKAKVYLLPETAKTKLKDTLEKIINNGSGGLIAIIL